MLTQDSEPLLPSDASASDDESHEPRKHSSTTNFETLVHLLKGNIGTGILAMPDAFQNAGWAIGLLGTLLMGLICTHCMHILVKCSRELCQRCQRPSLSFAQVAELALQTGPLRRYSRAARAFVNVFLCVAQLGFCSVYLLFVARNLQEVLEHSTVGRCLGLLLVPVVGLSCIKSLKWLAPVSLLGSLLTCLGLGVILHYVCGDLHAPVVPVGSWRTQPLFFGTAVYAFEGIGVVLPLENAMETPHSFAGILSLGMGLVTVLYAAIGLTGYLKYGSAANLGSITLLLPPTEVLAQSVKAVMALAIFCSYALQFYVAFQIIWGLGPERVLGKLTRVGLVLLTFGIAASVPNLGAVISLVGAFSSSTLALILPAVLELVTFAPNNVTHWMLAKNILIVLVGLAGFLTGSYVSLLSIIYSSGGST